MISDPVYFVSNFIRLSAMNLNNYYFVLGLLKAFYLTDSISHSDYINCELFASRCFLKYYFSNKE